jgi:uncharacterized protein YxjI
MMKFVVTQKLVSFGDDFWIRNENGEKVYFVDGAAYSFGDKLSLKDLKGRVLAEIRQKLFTFSPSYKILVRGELYATVSKKLLSFRRSYVIKLANGDILKATGGFVFNDYEIRDRDRSVARISKKIVTFSDSYGVEISSSHDPVFILCCGVIIDMIEHDKVKGGKG